MRAAALTAALPEIQRVSQANQDMLDYKVIQVCTLSNLSIHCVINTLLILYTL